MGRATGATTALPAIAALPYAVAYPFHLGFFNFSAGVAILLGGLAYFIRVRENLNLKVLLTISVFAIVNYFFHLTSGGLLVISLYVLMAIYNPPWRSFRETVKIYLRLTLAVLPAAVLIFSYLADPPLKTASLIYRPLRVNACALVTGAPFYFYTPGRKIFAFASVAVILVITSSFIISWFLKRKPPRAARQVAPLVVLTAVLYFALPDEGVAGGGMLSDRLLLFPILLLFFLVSDNFITPLKIASLAAATCFAIFNCIDLNKHYHYLGGELENLTAGRWLIKPGARLVFLNFAEGQTGLSVFLHAGNFYALGGDVLNFNNYQGDLPIFPVNFGDAGPRPMMSDMSTASSYKIKNFANCVDYIVIWDKKVPTWKRFRLNRRYKLLLKDRKLEVYIARRLLPNSKRR